jgi:hypothetical protein
MNSVQCTWYVVKRTWYMVKQLLQKGKFTSDITRKYKHTKYILLITAAQQCSPTKPATIWTDINTSVFVVWINGDKSINEAVTSHHPKYPYKSPIISYNTQYVTCNNPNNHIRICALSSSLTMSNTKYKVIAITMLTVSNMIKEHTCINFHHIKYTCLAVML